jgi:hypothetical protein
MARKKKLNIDKFMSNIRIEKYGITKNAPNMALSKYYCPYPLPPFSFSIASILFFAEMKVAYSVKQLYTFHRRIYL